MTNNDSTITEMEFVLKCILFNIT